MVKPNQGHSYFWVLGAILGAMVMMLPEQLVPGATRDVKFLMVNGGLFIVGVFLGTLDPTGVWRWGLATVLLLPALELSKLAPENRFATSFGGLIPAALERLPNYALQALPALLGAYLGSFFSKGAKL
jgi:hypothetical protein